MINKFTTGIKALTNEFIAMQAAGIYWLCVTHPKDAMLVSQQILTSQMATSSINVVQMAEAGDDYVVGNPEFFAIMQTQPAINYYALPGHIKALQGLIEDLKRARLEKNSLILLKLPAEIPLRMDATAIARWITTINSYLIQQQSTMVILSDGTLNHVLEKILLAYHRQLHGLASISHHPEDKTYHIRWWANATGMVASKTFDLIFPPQTESITAKARRNTHVNTAAGTNDAHLYYATENILEGAPPLSDHWRLYANNALLTANIDSINAATVIFSIEKSLTLKDLATQIYNLRKSRGSAIKIVVRELTPCLRYSDEYALLACGVNLIVPHSESLSSFLTRLESVQDVLFQRTLTTNLTELLANLRPIEYMGLVDSSLFHSEINRLIKNPHDTSESKGILIALKPVAGLTPLQALSLCHFRRAGDLALCTSEQLYLFLSACRINDVQIVLTRLFNLPIKDVFMNKMLWHQDHAILNELALLKTQPRQFLNTSDKSISPKEIIATPHTSVATISAAVERISPYAAPLILKNRES